MILKMNKRKELDRDGTPSLVYYQCGKLVSAEPEDCFKIIVRPEGFRFEGKMFGYIEKQSELQDFAQLITDVQKELLAIRKRQEELRNQKEKSS